MIEFLCPNGHRIRCQADQAGRAAKCPRCGVKFRVPSPGDVDISEALGSDSNVSRPDFTDSDVSGKKSPSSPGSPSKAQIEFLCPNGHRLHGSPALQGKPGQCPECGSRFRIPTYEEISAEEEAAQNISLGRAGDRQGPGSDAHLQASLSAKDRLLIDDVAMPTTISGRGTSGRSMASLVARFWEMRADDGALELHLRSGESLVPHQFLKQLSEQTQQGVFAVNEPDGSVSLMTIAWDAIDRATLRGLKELPAKLAE